MDVLAVQDFVLKMGALVKFLRSFLESLTDSDIYRINVDNLQGLVV